MAVKPVPDGYHAVTPYLVVESVPRLMDFLVRAFDAVELFRHQDAASGRVRHAEVRVGDSMVMMGEATAEHPPTSAALYLYVPDCDAAYRRAMAAGAVSLMEPADQFYGDRSGGVRDGLGNTWWIATHVEDVSHEELERRARARG